jgi:predicted ATPase
MASVEATTTPSTSGCDHDDDDDDDHDHYRQHQQRQPLEWRDVVLLEQALPPPSESAGPDSKAYTSTMTAAAAAAASAATIPSFSGDDDEMDDPFYLIGRANNRCSSSSSISKFNSCSDAVPIKLYGRDGELLELVQGFRRCIGDAGSAGGSVTSIVSSGGAPAKELLLVTGHSGSGKTSLVEAALRPTVAERGGWFVSGKFDLLERTEQYYPIVQALTEFAQVVAQVPARLHEVQAALEPYKETTRLLIDLIPSLTELLPEDGSVTADGAESLISSRGSVRSRRLYMQQHLHQSNPSSLDPSQPQTKVQTAPPAAASTPGAATRERLKFAVRQFLEAVCGRSSPIVLFLDDLQWAEPASLDLLGYLFNRRIPGLVLVGACRDNELSSFAHLSVLLRELETNHVVITQVAVHDLGVTALSYMICDVLKVDYTKAKILGAIVLDQTGGNMFFVVQFLRTLVRESLLYRTHDGTWAFESEARIRSVLGPGRNNVMHLVGLNIQKQDKTVQDVLMVASCLGAEFSEQLLKEAVSCDLEHPLRIAEAEGFLMKRSGSQESTWRFVHDQIQQTAYALIHPDEREEVHLQIGRKLWRALTEDDLDEHANVVVKQLRLGARLIVNEDEREQMAVLLLRTGELASRSAAHLTAQEYVGLAMSMLGRRHWRDQYQLSLRLYNSAAEIEYCIGNFDRVDQLTDEILDNARSNKDRIRAQTNRMYSLGSRNQLQEAIDVGLYALNEFFGIKFPSKPSVFSMIPELIKTKRILRRFSDDDILALPTMEDPMMLAAMRIMVLLFNYTLNGRPMLAPLMSMRLVQYSLLHGVSGMSSPAFSTLAMILCLAFNDPNSGIRYGKLGLQFLEAFDAKEWLPRVNCAVYGFCFTYTEPLQDQIQPLLLAHRVGLGGGDIEFALLSAALYTSVSIHSSARLSLLSSEVTTFLSLSDYYHQRNMAQYLRPNAQFIRCMRGACRNPSVLDGEALCLDQAIKEAAETKNTTVIALLLLLRILVASFFRQFEEVEKFGKELAKLRMNSFTCFCKAAVWLHEGISLVELSYYQQRRRRLGRAKQHLKNLVKLSAFSRHNYGNKVALLEAEISVAEGKFHQAVLKYEDAISLAEESRLWSDVGLASERIAFALRRRNRMDESLTYLDQAASAYERWGATAKVLEVRSSIRPDGVVRPCYPEELVSMTQSGGGDHA